LVGRQNALTGWQRIGRLEDIVGIVVALGLDLPISIAAVVMSDSRSSAGAPAET